VKRVHLAAIVIPLALAVPSCGGDDGKADSKSATNASPPAKTEQPRTKSGSKSADPSSSPSAKNGDGGSSATDAERAAKSDGTPKRASGGTSGKKQKDRAHANLSPTEQLARLSPKERRDLDLDLYKQGKDYCYASGPKQVAADNQLTVTDPAEIAERYARIREEAVPALILPFQQGCLAGFRRFERNPPKS
jgi:hypothetical protein